MDTIPPQFKKLAESAELYDQSEKVGQKFGLMIDQIGELDAEIRGVLLGIFKPTDFADHLVERLEIKKDLAEEITTEVNKEIFETIKAQLQKDTSEISSSHIADLEKVGEFEIEKESEIKSPGEYDHHIEPLVDHLLSKPTYIPTEKVVQTKPEPEVKQAEPAPVKPVIETHSTLTKLPEIPKKKNGPDLYREPIE